MQEQLVYNHPIPWKEERWQGSMIYFRQLWLLLTLVFSPHQFVMSRQTPVSRRCASKPATHAAHTSLWVCVECISTSAQPTSDKTEADKHQTPSARPPPCLSVLSMPSKPAARLTLTTISYVRRNPPLFASLCVLTTNTRRSPFMCESCDAFAQLYFHTWLARTRNRFPCLRGSECIAFCLVCNMAIEHMCMQMQRHRRKHADKGQVARAEPKHSAQNWQTEAFYCLTRRTMLFQATGQGDPAFWAKCVGPTPDPSTHYLIPLWQFEYSKL